MKTWLHCAPALSAWLVLCAAQTLCAQVAPKHTRLPNLDLRPAQAQAAVVPSEKSAGAAQLRERVSGLKVELDQITGSPKIVTATDGFLTGPEGKGATISDASLASFDAKDPHRVTKAFLQEHRKLFSHGPEALDQARIRRDDLTAHNGMRTVVWEQQVDGIAVFEGVFISHTTKKGELISVSSRFVPNPAQAATEGTPDRAMLVSAPTISARQAVVWAARYAEETLTEQDVASTGDVGSDPGAAAAVQSSRLEG